ncbi:MAG: cyclic nucleotide-binding domain-containing protein [Myxococcaceae bacterium]
MTELLQANLSLLIAAICFALLLALRAAVQNQQSRYDVRGALGWLIAFFALRGLRWVLPETSNPTLLKLSTVAWMLAFAFALIRTVVTVVLLLIRWRTQRDVPKIFRDVVDFALYAITAIPIVRSQLAIDLTGLLAGSAILSIVLGLALQDTLGNLFSGLSLQFERPYEIGDWIQVKDYVGKVVQVAWRSIKIETTRREVITVPNSVVSKEAVRKITRAGHASATEIFVTVSYDAPPNRVKDTMMDVLTSIEGTLEDPPPQILLWHFDDNGIRYRIRFYASDYRPGDKILDEFHSRIWYRFKREGMELPYPQRTVHIRQEQPRADFTVEQAGAILKQVDILTVLTEAERAHLAKELKARHFGKGEQVIEQGEEGQTFYVVAAGKVSVRTGTPSVEVTRLEAGQYFGEMSLLTGEPRTATVIALEDVILLELDRPTFARLFAGHPNLAKELSALLAHRRNQLRAALASAELAADNGPEAGRILSRLRQIFGLKTE